MHSLSTSWLGLLLVHPALASAPTLVIPSDGIVLTQNEEGWWGEGGGQAHIALQPSIALLLWTGSDAQLWT